MPNAMPFSSSPARRVLLSGVAWMVLYLFALFMLKHAPAGAWYGMPLALLPARASAATCSAVASTSAVSVLVIDCTTIGAPPPSAMPPTITRRVARRGAGPFAAEVLLIRVAMIAATGRKRPRCGP